MKRRKECRVHAWIGTGVREGDSHVCTSCGKRIRCTCELHFNAFSPVHAEGCALRGQVAGA